MNITYKIQFFEYWHSSSGLSAGTQSNLSVRKTAANLPILPGRAIKGLLNDAGYKIHSLSTGLVSEPFLKDVFGLGDDDYNDDPATYADSDLSSKGKSFFTNAELSAGLSKKLSPKDQKAQVAHLYKELAFTAIADNGMADDKTLRTIEVCVPLTLYAQIIDFPDQAEYLKQLNHCMQWVRRMGLNRTRGLGRCEWSIINPKIENQ